MKERSIPTASQPKVGRHEPTSTPSMMKSTSKKYSTTQRVTGIEDVFRKEIINQSREREECLKIQTEKLDLVFILE